jgi:hypothetical protein
VNNPTEMTDQRLEQALVAVAREVKQLWRTIGITDEQVGHAVTAVVRAAKGLALTDPQVQEGILSILRVAKGVGRDYVGDLEAAEQIALQDYVYARKHLVAEWFA